MGPTSLEATRKRDQRSHGGSIRSRVDRGDTVPIGLLDRRVRRNDDNVVDADTSPDQVDVLIVSHLVGDDRDGRAARGNANATGRDIDRLRRRFGNNENSVDLAGLEAQNRADASLHVAEYGDAFSF
ncbi:MAG: hypothetical protein H0W90_08595 [Actinobacteria bacterium]|nr:hypothetical protein [Actinomycetota bacterium]